MSDQKVARSTALPLLVAAAFFTENLIGTLDVRRRARDAGDEVRRPQAKPG